MPKQIDEQAVSEAQTAYNAYVEQGLTHKQAITATAEGLDIPRRRVNDWSNAFNWESEAPETEASQIRELAKQIDASETVIELAKRVSELEAAGELPAGTGGRIIGGETTARKVLNEYDRKTQERKPYSEREHKITVIVTNAEIDNYIAVMENDEKDDDALVRATLKFYHALQRTREK